MSYLKSSAIAALVALACSTAHADSITDYIHFEAGLGVNVYQTMADGTWQQQGAPYSHVKEVFPAAQIGARFNVYETADWGISLHTDYVYLGRASSDCWCTPLDSNYDVGTHRIINPNDGVPLAHFVGHGTAQGIALTIEPYLKRGAWRFGVEGGLFPYRPQWDETVSNWSNAPGMKPITVYAHTPNALQIGLVVGMSVERGRFGLSLRHYFLQPFGTIANYPPIYNTATVLMATFHY